MLKTKNIFKYLLAAHILIIIAVYYIEYILDVYACNLCKYQRLPFFLNIIALIFLIINKEKFFKFFYIFIFSVFINIGIATYHVGIEQKIFEESKVCKIDNNINNKEQLLKKLYKKNKPGCSEVTFKLLGFSLSSLNLMTNIVFLLISAHIYRNEKK